MKVKFNPYERVAGLFVLTAIVGSVAATVGVAIKKGWFDERIPLSTVLASADGVREGTTVQMAGLRAGSVTSVELRAGNEIHVTFEVSSKFKDRVREDSVVRVTRPFIIGEKVLEVSVGTETLPVLVANSTLKSEATTDIMDMMSGRSIGPYLATIGKMVESLRMIAETLLDPERSKSMIKIFDGLAPLVKNANGILASVNNKQQLSHVVNNLVVLTDQVNKALPYVERDAPQLAQDLTKIAHSTAILTDEISKSLPMLKDIGPELPRASRRALEALDETVVTLKALQKSFLLRGSVKDVRDEESLRRLPASEQHGQ